MMHRTLPGADGETAADRFGDVFFCEQNRGLNTFSSGEISRDGRRKIATRAMGMAAADARQGPLAKFFAVEEEINGWHSSVPALDNHAERAHDECPPGGLSDFPGAATSKSGKL